jgi:hypothetical protein
MDHAIMYHGFLRDVTCTGQGCPHCKNEQPGKLADPEEAAEDGNGRAEDSED